MLTQIFSALRCSACLSCTTFAHFYLRNQHVFVVPSETLSTQLHYDECHRNTSHDRTESDILKQFNAGVCNLYSIVHVGLQACTNIKQLLPINGE